MYTSGSSSTKKQRPTTTSYLVRPKLGALRSLYSNRPLSALSNEKRKRSKKPTPPKMDFRRKPDYADNAYREAVGRLRILLAESYTPVRSRIYGNRPLRELDSAGEETDNQSMMSGGSKNSRIGRSYYNYNYNPITPRKYYYPPLKSNIGTLHNESAIEKQLPQESTKFESNAAAPPELMSFIERQEDYIEQLEKESRFCKGELSSLLAKVKEVISENEHLHEKQKSKLIKSVFDHLETETETETDFDRGDKSVLKSPKKSRMTRIIEGPSIVFESRISELEAHLTQSRIDLKKAQEDNDVLRKKLSDGSFIEGSSYETYKRNIDACHREKEELLTKIKTLQSALSKFRDKENDTCDQVKRSLDVAEQAQYEKNAGDLEIRRLKDELERQHLKLRDAIGDQSRRISEERSAVERRYTQQIEQLTAEVGVQWETTNKLQLELDKQRRENADLRRECTQKQALIDELKKDMQNKILTLQSDIGVTGAEKSALEQQISNLNMANERTERQYKQEITRLQAEIQSLRQRMDRADADLIHSRRENIRLNEQVASLEKEINLNAALNDERTKSTTPRSGDIMALPPPAPKDDREKELTSMIHEMENKHAATVAELESMIHSQNQLMDKLSSECHGLTRKLDDASHKHKEEIRELQTNLDRLNNMFSQAQYSTTNMKDENYSPISNQRNSPISQAPSTSHRSEPQTLHRSESRSSLKSRSSRSRISSRQASQEKLSLRSTQLSPTPQQAPKNEPQYRTSDIAGSKYTEPSKESKKYAEPYKEPKKYAEPYKEPKQYAEPHKEPKKYAESYKEPKQYAEAYEEPKKYAEPYNEPRQYAEPYNEPKQYAEPYKEPKKYAEPYNEPNQYVDPKASYTTQQYDPNRQYPTDSSPQYTTKQYSTKPPQQYSAEPAQQYSAEPAQQYSAEPAKQYSAEPAKQYSVEPAKQYSAESAKQYSAEPAKQYSAEPAQQYSAEPAQQYSAEPAQQYSTEPAKQYSAESAKQYSAEPAKQYSTEPARQYIAEPARQYSAEPARQYSAEPARQYSAEPAQQYSAEPAQQYSTEPAQQYSAEPAQQYSAEPAQQYSAEPTQRYGTDPNQQYVEGDGQYQYDPNMQYDPNQQYEGDPNQIYDPNQQYDPSQQYNLSQGYAGNDGQYARDPNQYYADQNQSFVDSSSKVQPEDGSSNKKVLPDTSSKS